MPVDSKSEDDRFDCRLEDDPRFLQRIAKAPASSAAGKGTPWDETQAEDDRAARDAKR